MKNAKDYIRDDGPGCSTITSLAYWLTPEGLSNPVTAALLRKSLQTASDDEFREAFDGATKDDARKYLAVYELCAMPYWGADELAKAIHEADAGRDEKMALRAVALAQKAGELADSFTPRQGIEWAMDRGYLFGVHARFVGVPCAPPSSARSMAFFSAMVDLHTVDSIVMSGVRGKVVGHKHTWHDSTPRAKRNLSWPLRLRGSGCQGELRDRRKPADA